MLYSAARSRSISAAASIMIFASPSLRMPDAFVSLVMMSRISGIGARCCDVSGGLLKSGPGNPSHNSLVLISNPLERRAQPIILLLNLLTASATA